MGYKPTLILFLISVFYSCEGRASARSDDLRPYDHRNIGNWVRVPKGVNKSEVIDEIDARVGSEYEARIDEIPRDHPKQVFWGYDYAPCAPFDGAFLHACHARSETSSDVKVHLFEGVRAGNLYWKVPFTGVEVIFLEYEYGFQDRLDALDLEFFADQQRVESEEVMFSLDGVEDEELDVEKPAFAVLEHLKIIKSPGEKILVDIIAAPHKIDTMTVPETEAFLREMFAHLKEGGEIHLLWKSFQEPGDDKDYKIFPGSKDPRVRNKSFKTVREILEELEFTVEQPTYITDTLADVLDLRDSPDNYFISVVAKKN